MLDRIKTSMGLSKAPTTNSQEYGLLNEDFADQRPCQQHHADGAKTQWRWPSLALSFLLGALSAFALGLIVSSSIFHTPAATRRFPEVRLGFDNKTGLPLHWYNGDCGNSPAEARALGCHFDSAIHAWLPKDCLTDDDLEDEALMYQGRDWPYEIDGKNMTLEQVQAGDYHNITTTFDMHMTHCMYVLKRMHRVMLDATQKMDSYTVNFNHTTHCVHLLKQFSGETESEGGGHKLFVKYPICL
ncbi:hypothetical protein HRG_003834 [Hirsutella rhossiliensis]|uniref:Uncharacterized protein n=1 Tax=Hirsutella rhossiliensis TaxID=111463 RepID=A0A9P8N198_9HYPO|nr:uncharacterized protein HRG_03834 [Hirsutella rhossiliensis]KAH0965818.1 hypothetical protein HRG_03834 [Hirsutella rhossiliensis]